MPTEEPIPEEVKLEVEKDIIEDIPVEEEITAPKQATFDLAAWTPKTSIGKAVKEGRITNIDTILDSGQRIMEAQIVDILVPNMENDLLLIGQSRGKFGGGKRRIFKQTQKKTPEGNKPSFSSLACVGNKDGYVGLGYGSSRDTVPSREKAIRNAKLNLFKVRRGCGSWQCACKTPHSIPYAVEGKCGSAKIRLFPAPKGKGLVVEKECQKVLRLAGYNDMWSKTFGQTRRKNNLITALMHALKQVSLTKVQPSCTEPLGMIDGGRTE
ncbi:30S ribosomal protein S5 [Candidatus Woesearchaeota archaeon]|nr:30S ribosomal protein S5 [Candidatus Woesearchaeota archaeon]